MNTFVVPLGDKDASEKGALPNVLRGLWRQRDELGSIADELLEIFRIYGVAAPSEDERGHDAF